MTGWNKTVAWLTMMAALVSAIIIWSLARHGVQIDPYFCRYLVPVVHHHGVYTCSPHLRPVKP